MMDRSVPYIGLAMKADSLENLPVFEVPEGYGWRCFQPGDEMLWAEIETSAGEFPNVEEGLKGFRRYYPTDEGLDERMFFLTENDVPFATATAWYDEEDPDMGRLHWVSVDALHQGRGLSKAIVSLAMQKMKELGCKSAYLTTQTNSWVAIKVYDKFGFRPFVREEKEQEGWKIVSEKTGIDFMKDI